MLLRRYLDQFSKSYGTNRRLGQIYFTTVVGLAFQSSRSKMPFLRSAMLATQLVSPQQHVSDGIAKLVSKTDLQSLLRKDKALQVNAGEEMLASRWQQLASLMQDGGISERDRNDVFGKLSCRTVLFLVGKQKDGPERKVYRSFKDISDAYDADLRKIGGGAHATMLSQTAESSAGAPDQLAPASFEDVSSPQHIAKEAGFEVGNNYSHKQTSMVYKLVEMADSAVFQSVSLKPGEAVQMTVKYDDLRKSFVPYKGKLQIKLPGTIDTHDAVNNEALKFDILKASAYAEIMRLVMEAPADTLAVDFFLNPTECRAKVKTSKGAMRLLPACPMSCLSPPKPSSIFKVYKEKVHVLTIDPPSKMRSSDPADWKKDQILSAMFWVKESDEPS